MAFKLVHLTDIHLTAPGSTIAGRDPRANFDRALEHVLADHADAALMVITGDLSDWGERDDYVHLCERLARFPLPTRLCIGNHDRRPEFLAVYPELADADGFVQGVHDVDGHRCLFLDTAEAGTHAGRYCETRRAWLEARLSEHDGPFLLFMHHHPIPTHLGALDQIKLLDDVEFRALVGRFRDRIRHIFFGHCHLPLAGSCAGIPITSLRGTNHAGFPLFSETKLLCGSDLPEAYGVAFLNETSTTVVTVEYGYRGDIRIEGSPDWTNWDKATMKR